ncbi:FAD-binding oxidoreductase [Mesorhizobium sp.]|uniref:NAD(P)/FAD-dependent oxidoreductase n=1 Tax=Mesorhizobium sp. TaxID=1871066 RepID=UPI000FE2B793|nr:FAD-binding oxidoreductase [Mesorhizobium sp.]RWN54223.1 MAG: FAD-binding oxidoreductase [Mesorhizobium sp.]RWN79325.1 MAG: FAD-binding oxidoreductase [Mesorhizobium sp.]RWN84882.1 MAG: FAD-binding oxidoreductase [Mesorhizobium sp.]RWN93001.1 MAG: FAD-binding oxidoreductase [Mesorhizobium sp.]RWO17195.1 MAG: FAD-binding oxidoreductase [Mesorhizobium sp.]
MTASPKPRHVVVVGAGIFGTSTALHLARLGFDVTIVNDGAPSNGASGRSLSWLNSARRADTAYHRLRLAGIDRYRTLAATRPETASWLRFDGGLTWDADDEANQIASMWQLEQDIGYDSLLLDPAEVGAVTPGIDASAITPQGAIFNPGEGWVDLPSLIDLLLNEFRSRGGKLVQDAGRVRIVATGGRARGVVTAGGAPVEADAVVLAVGPATPCMLAEIGVHVPDATPISLLLKTKPIKTHLRAVLNTPRVAVRPTPDGALVLDSAWSEEEVVVNSDGTYTVHDKTVKGLLDEASAVLDGNPRLQLATYAVGPKPIPGDGEPVLGSVETVADLRVAFSHSGATLGLIVGELLAKEIASGNPHPMLATFRANRFG